MKHSLPKSATHGLLAVAGAALVLCAGITTAIAGEPDTVPGDGLDHHGRPIVILFPRCPGPAIPLPTPPPTPAASGGAGLVYQACPQLTGRAPAQVIQYALANPHGVPGYGVRRNPNVPFSPVNPYRTWLTLVDMGKPWNKCNTVVWKAGCP